MIAELLLTDKTLHLRFTIDFIDSAILFHPPQMFQHRVCVCRPSLRKLGKWFCLQWRSPMTPHTPAAASVLLPPPGSPIYQTHVVPRAATSEILCLTKTATRLPERMNLLSQTLPDWARHTTPAAVRPPVNVNHQGKYRSKIRLGSWSEGIRSFSRSSENS
jgi:hypothetical protein